MQASGKREIRVRADQLLGRCNVGKYGISDLFGECERLGYKLFRYPLGEQAGLGFAQKKDDDTIIFTNSSARLSREIFTLAHEIGHAVLHFDSMSAASFIDNNSTVYGSNADEKEQEANYFAACLLMPAGAVHRFFDFEIADAKDPTALDIARIMSAFHVSFDMSLNRLESLGMIDAAMKARLNCEKNETRVSNLLRCTGGSLRLNEAAGVIELPSEYIDYTIYNYNRNAVPRETLERVLAYYRLTYDDISDRIRQRKTGKEDAGKQEALDDLIRRLAD